MATIQGVYVALFGRPADPAGLAYFNGITNNGANLSAISNLSTQKEYTDRFTGMNNVSIINSIYQSLFGRDAETAGLTFFSDALTKGTLNINSIAIAILDGAQGTDKTIVTTKIAAADLYTKSIDTSIEIGSYSGNAAAASARAFIQTVTTTVPTQAAVDTAVASMVTIGAAGNTITLTAGGDTLSLTAGVGSPAVMTTDKADTINATTAGFWTAADKLDGGLGVDTLNATIAADVVVAVDGLKNIEILNVTSTADSIVTVTEAKQLTQIWDVASTADLTYTNATLTTTAGIKGAIGANDFVVTFADAGGSADAATLALNGATNAAGSVVSLANVETLTVSNTGTSNIVALTDANLKSLVVTGSGDLTLATGAGTTLIETVNTSAFTGNFKMDLSVQDALKTVTGGAGNENITVGLVHTNDITITAGDGADTLVVLREAGAATKAITLTGGAGADIFQVGVTGANGNLNNVQAVDTAANLIKTLVTISDFDKAADALKIGAGIATGGRDVLLTAETSAIASQSDILAAVTKAAEFTDVGKFSIFTFGSDSYVFENNGGAGLDAGDGLVKITGVLHTDFTATNLQSLNG